MSHRPIQVAIYRGATRDDTAREFEADAIRAAAEDYVVIDQSWDGPELTVTYQHRPAPRREPTPAPPLAPEPPLATELSIAAVGVLVGGLMAMAGAFLPWATVLGVSVSGMEGDGWIALALGVILALVGLVHLRDEGSGGAALAAFVFGLATAGLGIWKYTAVKDVGADSQFSSTLVQVGVGIWLIIAGGIIATIAAPGLRGAPRAPEGAVFTPARPAARPRPEPEDTWRA